MGAIRLIKAVLEKAPMFWVGFKKVLPRFITCQSYTYPQECVVFFCFCFMATWLGML